MLGDHQFFEITVLKVGRLADKPCLYQEGETMWMDKELELVLEENRVQLRGTTERTTQWSLSADCIWLAS